MKRRLVHVLAAITLVAAGLVLSRLEPLAAFAQPQAPTEVSIPRAYGEFRGVVLGILLFEDRNGTIRFVEIRDGRTRVSHIVSRR
jgi:hypothetical protein